jgi:hypothetical protein
MRERTRETHMAGLGRLRAVDEALASPGKIGPVRPLATPRDVPVPEPSRRAA